MWTTRLSSRERHRDGETRLTTRRYRKVAAFCDTCKWWPGPHATQPATHASSGMAYGLRAMQRSDGQADETKADQSDKAPSDGCQRSWDGTAASIACDHIQRMLTCASLASAVPACLATLFTLEYAFVRVPHDSGHSFRAAPDAHSSLRFRALCCPA